MAFINRLDSRSTLRKKFHPKYGIMGTAIFGDGGFTILLRSRPIFQLRNITVHAGQGAQLKDGKHCPYSCRHMEKEKTGQLSVRSLSGWGGAVRTILRPCEWLRDVLVDS